MTPEEWRPVVGFEGLYEVSDRGRVRSLDREVPFGKRTRQITGRVLKQGRNVHGRPFVMLGRGNNRQVHLLVLEAFVGPRPPGLEACHADDDPDNNFLDNLRWDTKSANMRDMVRNGKHWQTTKTHCPQGHKYTPENTKVGRNGGRWCRECHRIDERRRYHENLDEQRQYRREQARRLRAAKR